MWLALRSPDIAGLHASHGEDLEASIGHKKVAERDTEALELCRFEIGSIENGRCDVVGEIAGISESLDLVAVSDMS